MKYLSILYDKLFASKDTDVPDIEIELNGPFIFEEHVLRNYEKNKDLTNLIFKKINLCVRRQFIVLSNDCSFRARDNGRLQLGLTPHKHKLELCVNDSNISVLGLDGALLLDRSDCVKMLDVIKKYPLTPQELQSIKR